MTNEIILPTKYHQRNNITNKMAKLTSSIDIFLVSSNLYEIHETVSDGY